MERKGFTILTGGTQEVTPDIKVNTEEDLKRVRVSGTESATFDLRGFKKGINKLRWEICKHSMKTAFYYFKLIVKSVFSKEG